MDSKSTLRTAEPATVRPAGAVKVAPPPQPGDRLPQSSLSTLGRYAAALVAVVAATLLRMVIDPLVGEHRVPFITYFLAVVAAAWFGGCGPAVLTIVLSTLAASYFFLGPSGSLAVSSASDLASLGVFIAVGAAISAISESQRRERLRADEAGRRTADTLDSITDAFVQLTRDWRMVYVNAAAERHFGKRRQELLGHPIWELFPGEIGSEFHRALESSMDRRTTVQYEGVSLGGQRRVEARCYPTRDGVAVYWQDIEDRKRAEQEISRLNTDLERRVSEFETLIEMMPIGFYAVDSEGRLTVYNRRAAEMWGREPALNDSEELYCGAYRAFRPDGTLLPLADRPIRETIRCGTNIVNQEVIIERPDRSRLMALVNIAPLRDSGGEITGALNVFIDITERNQREQQIQRLNERLVRSMRETHHRVKNNLQVISALLDMQEMQHAESVPMPELRRIREHIHSLSIVHDLLTTQAREDSEVTDLSIKPLMERLLTRVQSMLADRVITSNIEDFRLPVRQAGSLAVLLHELVSNAIKHGRGEIIVRCALEKQAATLTVCDEGPGFPPGFDPAKGGTTGLELIHSLASWDLHGTTSYFNRPEGGACATVEFPVSPDPSLAA